VSASASVVLPDPDRPSIAMTRVPPHRAGVFPSSPRIRATALLVTSAYNDMMQHFTVVP
jgi:hypothetical protein